MRVEEELGTYLQVLWRYKWMIAACAIIASTVALGISFQLTPLYTGTATMRVESAPINWSLLTRVTNTLVETATSYTNLDEVARRLGLEKRPKVEVEIVPETELIRITASDPDPARARDIANTLASIMLEQSMEFYGNIRLTDRRKNLFTIIEPASLPQRPATPRVPLNAALGLSAGLATGVILAFFFEGMDDTLRGIEDVEAITTLSIMGQIPERKRTLASVVDRIFSRRGRLLPMPGFHQLSARLLLSEDWPKSTSFLITSPEPRAGKSTVAANLAMSLAAAGHRVVLADMDFRRPCQHSIFDLPNGKGLSDYMCGKIQLDAALQHALYPSLRVATAGSSPDGISEWLAPVKIGALLERLGKDGDYVLIDAPAWLSVADPAMIASQADAVILVVARRGTGRKQLRFALQQLTELNARIAGIVVNRASHSWLYTYYPERSPKKAEPIPSEEAQPQERADVRI